MSDKADQPTVTTHDTDVAFLGGGASYAIEPDTRDAEIERLEREWERECSDGDAVLHAAGLTPADYRTDGGSINVPKVRGALLAKEVGFRAEIERMGDRISQLEIDKAELRRELAEARGLLQEARPAVYYMSSADLSRPRVVQRIDAFLAATKEGER